MMYNQFLNSLFHLEPLLPVGLGYFNSYIGKKFHIKENQKDSIQYFFILDPKMKVFQNGIMSTRTLLSIHLREDLFLNHPLL